MSRRQYQSGAAKRKQRRQRIESEVKKRRTLEEFGWGAKKGKGEDSVDESIQLTSEAGTSTDEISVSVADQGSTDSDQGGGATQKSKYNEISPQQLSKSGLSLPSSDPAKWKELTGTDKEVIVLNGPPQNPSAFPRDSSGRPFPENIFYETLPNGEKVCRDWLVWSPSAQGLFCFPCCLFKGCEQQLSMLTRPDAGLKDNWRKLYDRVKSHQRSSAHLSRYCDWKRLHESLKQHSGIDMALQKQIEAETAKWREILKCILDVTLFLAERNLPFRGCSSKIGDPDNGLFLGTLELLSQHNKVLQMHLQEVKTHQDQQSRMQAHYLSWSSQNEFITECGKLVLDAVIKEVTSAFYYGIIVDGTPDVSHTEQITFVLRYAHLAQGNVWEIKERFLKYEDCEKKKGRDIAQLICKVLEESGIDLQNCRGQGYNNGANMAGIYRGAQAIILEKNPQAIFSPCSAHSLNLCGVHSAESSVEMKSFFGNVQKLYNLFSSSPARWKVLQETAQISLHRMSDTRWSARIDAVKPLVRRPREIVQALEKLQEDFDLPSDLCNEVSSLAAWLQTFEFVLLATFWFKTLQAINDVSRSLQCSKITLDEGSRLMKSLLSDLQRIRESWHLILQESKLVASGLGLQEEFRSKRRQRTKTFHGEDRSIVYEHENEEAGFRVTVFNVALDTLIREITSRFETTEKVNSMFSFIWNSTTDSNDTKAQELSKYYPRDLDAEQFVEEIRHLSNVRETLFGKVTSLELLNKIFEKGLQNLFPQSCVALRIFVSIPVSVSQGERSFSKLALVKNCLRSTMGQERLSALATLSLERDLARGLNYDSIINSFASRKARRINIM